MQQCLRELNVNYFTNLGAECYFSKLGCSKSSFPKRRGCQCNLPKIKITLLKTKLQSKKKQSTRLCVLVYNLKEEQKDKHTSLLPLKIEVRGLED